MDNTGKCVVFEEDGKWWFWGETWIKKYGPYDSKEKVARALWTYCVYELGISREEMEKYEPTRQD